MSYAFVFRAYPDVDHMAPLAWRLLEEGEEVHAIVSPGYAAREDYRLRFLSGYPAFHLYEIESEADAGRPFGAARAAMRRTLPWALAFLLARDVSLVCVEWGYGLRDGYDRLASRRGVEAVLRSIAGSVRRRREPRQVRVNFIVAARLLGRPCVSLPHGLSIKLGRGSGGRRQLGEPVDWRDRNRFAAFVLNTAHHRDWVLSRAGGDPEIVHSWGSVRWSPEWFALNSRLAPSFTWPQSSAGEASAPRKLRVLFMVPKWANHVDQRATLELVKRLHALDDISLAIKAHPRPEDGSADPLRADSQLDWSRITDVTPFDSVSLIAAADVVVDVGSSIGIEVVMQGKVLINPSYIHDFWTFFDEVKDSCVSAGSADDVVAYLLAHAAGSPHHITDTAYRELLRRGVYGSAPEPFDVLGTYCQNLRALTRYPSEKES